MNLRFNIQETVQTELFYGFYEIFILGGHYIKTNPDFYIQIVNIETNEEITLKEKKLKSWSYKFGRKATKLFDFQINTYGKFKILVHNFEDIEVKESMLTIVPFPFSIPSMILSAIFGIDRKKKAINSIELLIE